MLGSHRCSFHRNIRSRHKSVSFARCSQAGSQRTTCDDFSEPTGSLFGRLHPLLFLRRQTLLPARNLFLQQVPWLCCEVVVPDAIMLGHF